MSLPPLRSSQDGYFDELALSNDPPIQDIPESIPGLDLLIGPIRTILFDYLSSEDCAELAQHPTYKISAISSMTSRLFQQFSDPNGIRLKIGTERRATLNREFADHIASIEPTPVAVVEFPRYFADKLLPSLTPLELSQMAIYAATNGYCAALSAILKQKNLSITLQDIILAKHQAYLNGHRNSERLLLDHLKLQKDLSGQVYALLMEACSKGEASTIEILLSAQILSQKDFSIFLGYLYNGRKFDLWPLAAKFPVCKDSAEKEERERLATLRKTVGTALDELLKKLQVSTSYFGSPIPAFTILEPEQKSCERQVVSPPLSKRGSLIPPEQQSLLPLKLPPCFRLVFDYLTPDECFRFRKWGSYSDYAIGSIKLNFLNKIITLSNADDETANTIAIVTTSIFSDEQIAQRYLNKNLFLNYTQTKIDELATDAAIEGSFIFLKHLLAFVNQTDSLFSNISDKHSKISNAALSVCLVNGADYKQLEVVRMLLLSPLAKRIPPESVEKALDICCSEEQWDMAKQILDSKLPISKYWSLLELFKKILSHSST